MERPKLYDQISSQAINKQISDSTEQNLSDNENYNDTELTHLFIPGDNEVTPNHSLDGHSTSDGHSTKPAGGPINPALEREAQGCYSVVLYCSMFIFVDFWKQLTSYGMTYYNEGFYPIPQTQIVALAETCKFGVFFYIVIRWEGLSQLKISLWFAVPSVIYALNNNLFYFALHYATPPVWYILIQLRLPLTALFYRLVFGRMITTLQWLALVLLVVAVAATNWSGSQTLEGISLLPALTLAVVGSVISVIGALVMEFLFKNDSRSFYEMQVQLYLFGSVATWSLYSIEVATKHNQQPVIKGSPNLMYALIIGDVLLTCLSGFIVAVIIKKLDNIVKLYSQSISNISTSIACSIAFSDRFHINATFIVCLLVVFGAVFMYENKELGPLCDVISKVTGPLRTCTAVNYVDRLYRKVMCRLKT